MGYPSPSAVGCVEQLTLYPLAAPGSQPDNVPTLKPNIYASSDPKFPKIHSQSPPPALFQAPHEWSGIPEMPRGGRRMPPYRQLQVRVPYVWQIGLFWVKNQDLGMLVSAIFGFFPSLTGNMGWEDQNLPVKKFITLGANTGFLCGMLWLTAVTPPPPTSPGPGKFLNLSRCGWIPTGMVTPEPGGCSFGILGVLAYTPHPCRIPKAPSAVTVGQGWDLGNVPGVAEKGENGLIPPFFLANPLFFSLFQPIFTVFHQFSPC